MSNVSYDEPMNKNSYCIFEHEIIQDDNKVRTEFLNHFQSEIFSFIEAIAEAYNSWQRYDDKIGGNHRRAYVAAYFFNSINNLSASMKLLISGYPIPSGNLMRQTIESICSAILCSSEQHRYFQNIEQNKFSSNKAVQFLIKHSKTLNVNRDAILSIKQIYDFYHKLSHSSLFALTHNISLSKVGTIYVGASFDEGKIIGYRKEIKFKKKLAGTIKNAIEGIINKKGVDRESVNL